jgi:ribonuclease HI
VHVEPYVPEQPAESLRHTLIVDASYSDNLGVVGIGIVHHATDRAGRFGPVVGTYSEAYLSVPPHAAEEFAVLRALEIAASYRAGRVKVRSDCNQMRRRLKRAHTESAAQPSADLRSTVLRLASTFAEVKFGYVQRRKNGWAHRLARLAIETQSPQVRNDIAWHARNSDVRFRNPRGDGSCLLEGSAVEPACCTGHAFARRSAGKPLLTAKHVVQCEGTGS